MARGRKKKVNKVDTNVVVDTTVVEEKKKREEKPKYVCLCELCNSEVYTSPRIIRLNDITGCANWHRECKSNQLSLCDKCSLELNGIIDNYIISKNPELRKFPIDSSSEDVVDDNVNSMEEEDVQECSD